MEAPMWRRCSAVFPRTAVLIEGDDLRAGTVVRREVGMPEGSPIRLRVDAFSRRLQNQTKVYLVTVVLRNCSQSDQSSNTFESTLYQSYFEVSVEHGHFEKYPESERPFGDLDSDEQSLSLLYREAATWGIGHGCAAGWDSEPGQVPHVLYADVLPAVETPSTTPDIRDAQGGVIRLSMRELARLPDEGSGCGWQSLSDLADEYARWIEDRRGDSKDLSDELRTVAQRHLGDAAACLARIKKGIEILRTNKAARTAFKLTNLGMLLQQITSKQLKTRPLSWNQERGSIYPAGGHQSPWKVYADGCERADIGFWRPFQIAFLLMSLNSVVDETSPDREIVDLIWFPTGGGKTEAYLALMTFYMFHQRLLMEGDRQPLRRDGTNVLMRYTLRMLTTQQFQRAASLICSMEFLRRNPSLHSLGSIPGTRFSVGLWLGGSGSPNRKQQAVTEVEAFRADRTRGNPLILTECPWCRAEIGRYGGQRPRAIPQNQWRALRVRGISIQPGQGPLLHCPDPGCPFGTERPEDWLPVEVIDERIYDSPPSLVIATADKFAMIAFRPAAGAIFGRSVTSGEVRQTRMPPGLIVQDELHLISGPLGTIYGLYEAIFERLCSYPAGTRQVKPKIIASTATIRGADEQTKALYAREQNPIIPEPRRHNGRLLFWAVRSYP
jgi:hypothetical protein